MSNGDDKTPAEDDASEDANAPDEETPADDASDETADSTEETGDSDEEAGETSDSEGGETTEISTDTLESRLDDAEAELEAAETEADLDEVEAKLDSIEADLERADLPEPDEDDEEGPRAELEARLEELRGGLEEQRGPYAEDVVASIEESKTKIEETRWTERGEREIVAAVEAFTDRASETLRGDFAPAGEDEAALTDALSGVATAVSDAGLDPDDDAENVAALVEAADRLEADLEDAQEWEDLQTHEQLAAEGFFDALGHYKDFPPELSAIKEWERRGNVEMILLAHDAVGSDFMERHCVEALTRMNDPAAFDAMHALAEKRNKPAIKALGKMAAADAVETLLEFVDTDSDPALQKVTFKALGEIGSEEATQALANKLEMDNDNVRPYAARALGLIGDPRAVDPLTDVLADDESDAVRTATAWALRQIGTRSALEAAAEYGDDQSYVVQHEADLATRSLSVTKTA